MTNRELEGRAAVVSGAGRGIGRAIALALAGRGARMWLTARTASELEETAALCREAGAEATALPADLGRLDSARTLADRLRRERVDILVNNAGMLGPVGPTHEVEVAAWIKTFEVNLFGALALTQGVVPGMITRKEGRIIFLSGGGATQPMVNMSAYSASKAAVVRLAETLSVELQPHHIFVNAVAPGMVDTKLQDDVLRAGTRAGEHFERMTKVRREGRGAVPPEVAAELVAFLASARSGALTGKLISAPHDPWKEWGNRADDLNATPLYTLRRLDAFTIRPLIDYL